MVGLDPLSGPLVGIGVKSLVRTVDTGRTRLRLLADDKAFEAHLTTFLRVVLVSAHGRFMQVVHEEKRDVLPVDEALDGLAARSATTLRSAWQAKGSGLPKDPGFMERFVGKKKNPVAFSFQHLDTPQFARLVRTSVTSCLDKQILTQPWPSEIRRLFVEQVEIATHDHVTADDVTAGAPRGTADFSEFFACLRTSLEEGDELRERRATRRRKQTLAVTTAGAGAALVAGAQVVEDNGGIGLNDALGAGSVLLVALAGMLLTSPWSTPAEERSGAGSAGGLALGAGGASLVGFGVFAAFQDLNGTVVAAMFATGLAMLFLAFWGGSISSVKFMEFEARMRDGVRQIEETADRGVAVVQKSAETAKEEIDRAVSGVVDIRAAERSSGDRDDKLGLQVDGAMRAVRTRNGSAEVTVGQIRQWVAAGDEADRFKALAALRVDPDLWDFESLLTAIRRPLSPYESDRFLSLAADAIHRLDGSQRVALRAAVEQTKIDEKTIRWLTKQRLLRLLDRERKDAKNA